MNCAAIVETLLEAELFGIEERTATGVRGRRGKFEHAHEGTLFLDEVSDLSAAAQAKLLRAIQEMSIERVGGTGSTRGQHADRRGHEPAAGGLVAAGGFGSTCTIASRRGDRVRPFANAARTSWSSRTTSSSVIACAG